MKTKTILSDLETTFKQHANGEIAQWQTAYMKHQFQFFGIKTPVRAKLQKSIFNKYPIHTTRELISIVQTLWNQDEREYQYAAIDLLKQYKQLWDPGLLPILEWCITTKSWWDSVDDLARLCVGPLLLLFPDYTTLMDEWIKSPHMWLRRSAIIFQLRYKQKTNIPLLFSYCTQTMHEKEFFIRKAIGWALRELSKTAPHDVLQFVETHKAHLSSISLKEAIKYLPSS